MINKLLNYFGYISLYDADMQVLNAEIAIYEEEDESEDDLAFKLASMLQIDDDITPEYEKQIFKDLQGTENLVAYLKESAARDKDRYFGATTKEEQLIIRGAFARTMYLKAKITGADSSE